MARKIREVSATRLAGTHSSVWLVEINTGHCPKLPCGSQVVPSCPINPPVKHRIAL